MRSFHFSLARSRHLAFCAYANESRMLIEFESAFSIRRRGSIPIDFDEIVSAAQRACARSISSMRLPLSGFISSFGPNIEGWLRAKCITASIRRKSSFSCLFVKRIFGGPEPDRRTCAHFSMYYPQPFVCDTRYPPLFGAGSIEIRFSLFMYFGLE